MLQPPVFSILNNNRKPVFQKNPNDCPDHFAVIKKVVDNNARNFSHVRDRILLDGKNLKIINSKLTNNNTLILEFFDKENCDAFIKMKPELFGSKSIPMNFIPNHQRNGTIKLLIKYVDPKLSDEDIKSTISQIAGANPIFEDNVIKARRLSKNNMKLKSVLIEISNKELSKKLTNEGITLHNSFHLPTPFIEKSNVRFCEKCLNYGHLSKFCRRENTFCRKCTKIHDIGMICEKFCKQCCVNDHQSGENICPYLRKISSSLINV